MDVAGLLINVCVWEVQTVQYKACSLFFGAVGLMRQMLAASQGDMVNDSTISSQSIETCRLFLRVCNTYDTRSTH